MGVKLPVHLTPGESWGAPGFGAMTKWNLGEGNFAVVDCKIGLWPSGGAQV